MSNDFVQRPIDELLLSSSIHMKTFEKPKLGLDHSFAIRAYTVSISVSQLCQ